MVVVLLTVTGGVAYLGAAVIARHRAQAAADLAALAAAARVPAGAAAACTQAETVAHAMRAGTAGCVVDALDVVITVELSTAGDRWGSARAAARAGPA
jgi:secretion/DNA translocation related TadE-like protein